MLFPIHILYGFKTPFELIDSMSISHTIELFIKVYSKNRHTHKDTNIHTHIHNYALSV